MGLATLKYQLLDYSSWLSHGVRPQPLEIDASAYESIMDHQVSWYSLYNEKIKRKKYSKYQSKIANCANNLLYSSWISGTPLSCAVSTTLYGSMKSSTGLNTCSTVSSIFSGKGIPSILSFAFIYSKMNSEARSAMATHFIDYCLLLLRRLLIMGVFIVDINRLVLFLINILNK